MDEEKGLLRAILAEPADETARLAYADWLEERGDPRGEFLRGVMTLAAPGRLPKGGGRGRPRERLGERRGLIDAGWAGLMDTVVRVAASWRQIEETLKEYAPEDFKALGRPATEEQVAKLERAVGRPLPADLLLSLRVHNGMGWRWSVFDGETLLSAARIAEEFRRMKGMAERGFFEGVVCPLTRSRKIRNDQWWDPAWVPITHEAGGSMYVLDQDPLPGGKVGQVFYFWVSGHFSREVVAPSFAGLLEKVARRFARGELKVEDGTVWLHLNYGRDPRA